MKWINKLTAYNFKIFYQKKVSNSVNDLSRRLDYEKDINADEREFTCDLAYMRELLKNLLNQSASTLIIFTWQFKILSIRNHKKIVIRSFKKIINLSVFTKRIKEVSQTLKKLSTADKKSQWWFQNIIISCQKNICFCKNIELRFTTVVKTREDVCSCKNIESIFITVAEIERNVIQMRWKRKRANFSAEESKCLIMSQSESSTMCCFADESKCLIMSQSRILITCCSVKRVNVWSWVRVRIQLCIISLTKANV